MIIFICPTVFASGGPEAIHQLAGKCKKMGIDVGIYYFNPNKEKLDDRLAAYGIKAITQIIDSSENIIIFPESTICEMQQIKYAVRVLWWLSVDNARMNEEDHDMLKNDKSIIHFSQSFYSTQFIKDKFGVEDDRIFYVSDYLNTVYLNVPDDWVMAEIDGDYSLVDRERLVLFNPKKGFENTAMLIMNAVGDIKWQALNGMSPAQMRAVMQKAMIYIDFGNHPGMDRIPREAAVSGCCIITNKKGSAANSVDVPIANCYKKEPLEDGFHSIINQITEIMDDYANIYTNEFMEYTKKIREQFKEFEVSIYKALRNIAVPCTEVFRKSSESLIASMNNAFENDELENAYRYMVEYRCNQCIEDEKFLIYENAIRNSVGEYDEAKYCALKALIEYPQSYELYLGLIQSIMLIVDRDGYVSEQNKYYYNDCIEKALMYSAGTEDEDMVKEILKEMIE